LAQYKELRNAAIAEGKDIPASRNILENAFWRSQKDLDKNTILETIRILMIWYRLVFLLV
jgi:hypothetical protein